MERFQHCDLSPSKIGPSLADKCEYITSEATFYRLLKEAKQDAHRGKSKPKQKRTVPRFFATGPNQVNTWDITYLPTEVKGQFYYLYLFLDLFSRKIVGPYISDTQTSFEAARLTEEICQREGVDPKEITIHSDNGSPMKGATLLATFERLGIAASFSRPSVSNDNAFLEAMFKTVKYSLMCPTKPFPSLDSANEWMSEFTHWYNEEHLHSGIKYVTPSDRHNGIDKETLLKRHELYQQMKLKNPLRWSGSTRDWEREDLVWINKPNKEAI